LLTRLRVFDPIYSSCQTYSELSSLNVWLLISGIKKFLRYGRKNSIRNANLIWRASRLMPIRGKSWAQYWLNKSAPIESERGLALELLKNFVDVVCNDLLGCLFLLLFILAILNASLVLSWIFLSVYTSTMFADIVHPLANFSQHHSRIHYALTRYPCFWETPWSTSVSKPRMLKPRMLKPRVSKPRVSKPGVSSLEFQSLGWRPELRLDSHRHGVS